ncbi:MAG: ABC transporter ATP-binding protein/permease [Oscillospiraceae bacterium]|jgi:ATP-binding cassette subfamily B protein|nr:ABC transporter ATP-binding protein/permease [Oscillospiraceae bacterium]
MLKVLRRLSARELLVVAVCLALTVAQTWLDLELPDYMEEITRVLQTPDGTMSDIWSAGVGMLLITLASAATAVLVGLLGARLAAGFSMRLRSDIFTRVSDFSMEEINSFSTASLITRTTNDITQVQMLIAMGLQVVIKAPIMAVWALAKVSAGSWEWLTLTGGSVVSLVVIIASVMSYAHPRFRRIQTLTDNITRVTRENLTGIRVVRAYNAEEYQEQKFEQANEDLTDNNLAVHRVMAVFNPCMRLIMSGLTLGIYWIGAFLIESAALSDKAVVFSEMIVFSQYATQVLMSFMMLTMIFVMGPRVAVSAKRINEVLDTVPKLRDGAASSSPEGVRGDVEFRGVSFRYPDAEDYVLRDISFTARGGETVAFIGSTGSGKSTLINLVPRFYDATEGQILIDGVDVREYTQEALRKKIGYIPQRAVMFTGDVTSNIAFGDSAGGEAIPEDVSRAAMTAQAADFIEDMDGGYSALVSQGGTNISGGQKQRLSIARAIYRDPEILVFDDSFSALDYRTDRELRAALKRDTHGVTSLIVAQRIGTIRDADRIIVLDDGLLVGSGTHDELMRDCEVYREIAYSQLSREELGA